jgi:hypothetical protein
MKKNVQQCTCSKIKKKFLARVSNQKTQERVPASFA